MKPREQRLQAILERIRDAGPAGADSIETVNWASGEYGVSTSTAQSYLQDLWKRRALELRFGRFLATGRDTRGRL